MRRTLAASVYLFAAVFLCCGFFWSRKAPSPENPPSGGAATNQESAASAPDSPSFPSNAPPDNPQALQDFKKAYEMLLKADLARSQNKLSEALRLYEEAHGIYTKLANKHPDWESSVIRFRIAYCDVRVREMLKTLESERSGSASTNREESTSAPPIPAAKGTNDPPQTLPDLSAEAKKLLEKGKAQEARDILVRALRMDPNDPTIRLLIGMAQCQAGNFQDAVQVLKSLVSEYPDNAHAFVAIGTAYYGLGSLDEAKDALLKALKLNPSLHEAHYNLAQILLTSKPPDKAAALQHYQKALELGAKADKKLEKALNK